MNRACAAVAGCLIGYGIGSLPFGVWLSRVRRGVDVREHGSGSSGTTNVLRIVGPGAAAATFALDVGKGAAAVRIARSLGASESGQAAAGLAAVVGHSWPVWARFRGGKSVATGLGGLAAMAPPATAPAVGAGLVALALTRTVSVGSLAAASAGTVASGAIALRTGRVAPLLYAAATSAIIVSRHRANIDRLASGREPRLSLRSLRGGRH